MRKHFTRPMAPAVSAGMPSLSKFSLEMESVIAERGFIVQSDLEDTPELGSVVYTVGLYEMGLPELLVSCASSEFGASYLHEVVAWMQADFRDVSRQYGRHALPNDYSGISPEFCILPVPREVAEVFASEALARSHGQAAVSQLILPDFGGRFPWEPAYDPGMRATQQMYGEFR